MQSCMRYCICQGSILPTNSLVAMHNCRWKVKYNIADNFSRVSARSINTFFFCFFLKNNLRRINCTVMEVKYCHLSSKMLILAAHLKYCVSESLCKVFSGTLLVLWLMQLCSVLLAFFSSSHTHSIHVCLICATSAYLNTTALLICSRQITANSLPKLSTFASHKCLPASKIIFTAAIKE